MKGLIGSSKRVLSGTKNEDKIKAIKEGVGVLEGFLDKFDRENRSQSNLAYLPASVVTALKSPSSSLCAEFVKTYAVQATGNYKHLRTLFPRDDDSKSWDIVRNEKLHSLRQKLAKDNSKLFNENGSPTEIHLQMIHWAYSPQPEKVKAHVDNLSGQKSDSTKRKSSDSNGSGGDSVSQAKKRKSK